MSTCETVSEILFSAFTFEWDDFGFGAWTGYLQTIYCCDVYWIAGIPALKTFWDYDFAYCLYSHVAATTHFGRRECDYEGEERVE